LDGIAALVAAHPLLAPAHRHRPPGPAGEETRRAAARGPRPRGHRGRQPGVTRL